MPGESGPGMVEPSGPMDWAWVENNCGLEPGVNLKDLLNEAVVSCDSNFDCVESTVGQWLFDSCPVDSPDSPIYTGNSIIDWTEFGVVDPNAAEEVEEKELIVFQHDDVWTPELTTWMDENCGGSVLNEFTAEAEYATEEFNQSDFIHNWYVDNCPTDLIPPNGNPTLGPDECDEVCGESEDCREGVACYVQNCTNPCTGERHCYQEYLQHYDLDW